MNSPLDIHDLMFTSRLGLDAHVCSIHLLNDDRAIQPKRLKPWWILNHRARIHCTVPADSDDKGSTLVPHDTTHARSDFNTIAKVDALVAVEGELQDLFQSNFTLKKKYWREISNAQHTIHVRYAAPQTLENREQALVALLVTVQWPSLFVLTALDGRLWESRVISRVALSVMINAADGVWRIRHRVQRR
jgi:hypothetical protein